MIAMDTNERAMSRYITQLAPSRATFVRLWISILFGLSR